MMTEPQRRKGRRIFEGLTPSRREAALKRQDRQRFFTYFQNPLMFRFFALSGLTLGLPDGLVRTTRNLCVTNDKSMNFRLKNWNRC